MLKYSTMFLLVWSGIGIVLVIQIAAMIYYNAMPEFYFYPEAV